MSPWAPPRACSAPGCGRHAVKRGRCQEHQREGQRLVDQRRGSRQSRGYDERWAAYSRQYRLDHPLCADPFHLHGSLGSFAECVDHVVPPWAGGDFWDAANHQPLCLRCNAIKAGLDARKYANVK